MKIFKFILLIMVGVFLIVPPICSQSIEKLDENNGFKEFQFGDPISKWDGSLSNRIVNETGYYGDYIGDCCWTAFHDELDSIKLGFDLEEKLYMIYAEYKYPTDDILKVLNKYKAFFGPNTTGGENDDLGMGAWWIGEKIILMLNFEFDKDSYGWNVVFLIKRIDEEERDKLLKPDF